MLHVTGWRGNTTVRAAVAAHTHCRLCSLRRSANKVIVTYWHCVAV